MKKDDVRFSVDLDREVHKELKVLCALRGISMREIVVSLLEKWAEKERKGNSC